MSYTPVVRWRNFQVEHVKTILELFPDMLTKMSRKEVVDEIETKLPGYTATAYQDLELDVTQLSVMGCEYIFSAMEIVNAENLKLSLEGIFETPDSYYKVYTYSLE